MNQLNNNYVKGETSIVKYYMLAFANKVRAFTATKIMVSIVNGFISVMPIIIAASIITLILALPDTVIKLIYSSDTKSANAIEAKPSYVQFTNWGGIITNWSMGLIGMFATASIARNLTVELNAKLPFDRKVNEIFVFFAALTCYGMLSVIVYSVGSKDSIQSLMGTRFYDSAKGMLTHTGRSIFTDALGAQGILPGILVGITMPWFFYWAYKYNWTIRLPKQVPQTISQAFLSVVPLFVVLVIYGTIAWGLQFALQMPFLFYIFTLIQQGLTNNPNLNNSYGLIVLHAFLESGFWFIGVHPEPVHALFRATFWISNLNYNIGGPLYNPTNPHTNIFIEPLAYGFAAMGGSGTTLMVPMICLLFGRSSRLKVVGNTATVPIIFQVNEPCLFGVPCILNPIFAIPFLFTGMINNVLFKALADSTGFQAGALWLPWSTPYFLQTTLPTPTEWQPWMFSVIAFFICTLTYFPFVLIQDKVYLKEEMANNLNVNTMYLSRFDVFKMNVLGYDSAYKNSLKMWINQQKEKLNLNVLNASDSKRVENEINTLMPLKKTQLKLASFQNLIVFSEDLKSFKLKKLQQIYQAKVNGILETQKLHSKKLDDRIAKYQTKIGVLQEKIDTLNEVKKYKTNKLTKMQANKDVNKFKLQILLVSIKVTNFQSHLVNQKFFKYQNHITKYQGLYNQKQTKKVEKNPAVDFEKDSLKINYQTDLVMNRIYKRYSNWSKKMNKEYDSDNEVKNLTNSISSKLKNVIDENKIKTDYKTLIGTKKADWLKANKQGFVFKPDTQNESITQTPHTSDQNNLTNKDITQTVNKELTNKKVLVLCLGAGSSAVMANAINTGLIEMGIKNITTTSLAWGNHDDAIKAIDLLILSPQLGIQKAKLNELSKEYGFKMHACKGADYIQLSNNPNAAAKLVLQELDQPISTPSLTPTSSLQQTQKETQLQNSSEKRVLVLCVGAGSSAVLANAINNGLQAKGIKNINATSLAWGNHDDAIKAIDLLILSPQLGIQKAKLKELSKEYGFKMHACKGADYIQLSNDANAAAELVLNELDKKEKTN